MIRTTLNQSVKTIARDAKMHSESIELTTGGVEMTEKSWDAAKTKSPVHSNEWWDGTAIKR